MPHKIEICNSCVDALAVEIMEFCQERGHTPSNTAFACVLVAAVLGAEKNEKSLASFFKTVCADIRKDTPKPTRRKSS